MQTVLNSKSLMKPWFTLCFIGYRCQFQVLEIGHFLLSSDTWMELWLSIIGTVHPIRDNGCRSQPGYLGYRCMATLENDLLKFDIPEIVYGIGALSSIGDCAQRLGGERVFLVTDPGIVEAGWVDEALRFLKQVRLEAVVYDNVVTNPRDYQVDQGVQRYLEQKCDVIVGLGGGSPMDTAKGIAILVHKQGSIHD